MSNKEKTAKDWILAKWESQGLYITIEGRFYTKEGKELKREYKQGICYRVAGSAKRHYYKKLNREKQILNKVVKWPKK